MYSIKLNVSDSTHIAILRVFLDVNHVMRTAAYQYFQSKHKQYLALVIQTTVAELMYKCFIQQKMC